MSLLRPYYTSRLLQTRFVTPQRIPSSHIRWASKTSSGEYQDRSVQPAPKSDAATSPAPTPGDSGMIRQQGPGEGIVDHQPDYHAPIDHATSNFSPIPKRVMDGSESGDILPASILSGAPVDLQARQVRIYRPAKTATQSGDWHAHHWRMDWDILQKGYRWENPLMGWQSSADSLQGTHLNFKSREDAIYFAEKQGYEYFVQEPNERRFVPKAYANNFLHSSKKLKKIPTK